VAEEVEAMTYMDKVREKIEERVENYKRSRTSLRKTIAEDRE